MRHRWRTRHSGNGYIGGAPPPPSWLPIQATGGDIVENFTKNGKLWRRHIFWSTDDFVVTDLGTDGEVTPLLQAGGGGVLASAFADGGGGAGGLLIAPNTPITIGAHTVVIGSGGNAANGNDTTFLALTAIGGGGVDSSMSLNGNAGGCGAGGSAGTVGDKGLGGAGSQGFNGGNGFDIAGTNNRAGGGGGGVLGNGTNGASGSAGVGGVGANLLDFCGYNHPYGGGGGGGCNNNGGSASFGGGQGGNSSVSPTNGAANTGAGGGGNAPALATRINTIGGSGFAAIIYPLENPN